MMSDLFKQSSVFSGINKSDLGQLASSLQCDNTFKAQMDTNPHYGYDYLNHLLFVVSLYLRLSLFRLAAGYGRPGYEGVKDVKNMFSAIIQLTCPPAS